MSKHAQWSEIYASVFQDTSVAAAYRYRPTYPPETFSLLQHLLPAHVKPHRVLDAGCGTGLIARPLALLVDYVDAVDVSVAMIAAGQLLPGGDQANISWTIGADRDGTVGRPVRADCGRCKHPLDGLGTYTAALCRSTGA